jgi:hypothetical protein
MLVSIQELLDFLGVVVRGQRSHAEEMTVFALN